jgi:PST family polysaccharide transporter
VKPFDENGMFRPHACDARGGFRHLAIRGAGATLLSGGMGLAIQIVSAAVLARLLAPADFGVVTMVTTFSLLLMNFGLNGFTEGVVQRDSIDQQLVSNLFWINASGSAALALGFACAGPLLFHLYKDPRVIDVTRAMALTIFLTGLSVIHLALLKRAMRFDVVSLNDIAARLISVTVAITLGFGGWGYWALVAAAVALPLSTCMGAWTLCRWIPNLPSRHAGTGALVRFAIHTYGRFTTGYFANNLDNFLVGWRLGPTPLGFYKKAYDLFVLPSNQLSTGMTTVAVSALSRLQHDREQYKRYLIGALGVMAFVGMGLSANLTLVGNDLIRVLLGAKWSEAGRLFTIFGPGIGAMLLYCTHIWIHLSIGRADRWFSWGLIDLAVTTLFLLVGLHWGAEGIAVAWVVSYWIIMVPALWFAGKPIGLGVSQLLSPIWKYVVASTVAGSATFLVVRAMPQWLGLSTLGLAAARLVLISLVFVVFYLTVVVVMHRGFGPLQQILGLLREMMSRRRSEPSTKSMEDEVRVQGNREELLPGAHIVPEVISAD